MSLSDAEASYLPRRSGIPNTSQKLTQSLIVNEDCAVRGITKVYFKNLTSKKVISESKRIASLELWAPDIAGIKVKKKTTKKKTTKKSTKKSKSKKSKSKSPAKDSRNTSRGKKAARAAVK